MKFCQFKNRSGERAVGVSVANDTKVADLKEVYAALAQDAPNTYAFPSDMKSVIEGGEDALIAARFVAEKLTDPSIFAENASAIYDFDDLHIYAPIEDPQKFFAIAINRHGGWDTAIKPENPHPTYFVKLASCLTGPKDTVYIPDVGQVGPEIELAIIIGKGGKSIKKEDALDHVFGYAVHNDITAHDMRKSTAWIRMVRADGSEEQLTYPGRYKNFDSFSPMGPWLVTSDEAPAPDGAILDAWVNDDHVQHGTTSEHVYDAAHLISYLSQAHALKPGDIISTGTVGPVEPWTMATIDLAKIGGVMHSSIEGLGKMSNPIEFVKGLK